MPSDGNFRRDDRTARSGGLHGLPSIGAAGSPAVRKVAAYARQHKPVPWVRVYTLQDIVFFSHKRHAGAKVVCVACHGKVCESTVLKRDFKFSMVFCVNCHKARKATVKCNACDTLSMR